LVEQQQPSTLTAPAPPQGARATPAFLVCLAGLSAALLWSYWPLLVEAAQRWASDPQYSHGFLVPVFSAALLWLRRRQLDGAVAGLNWWGLPFLLVGAALRMAASYTFFDWLALFSLLPCLAGLAVLFTGWRGLRWAGPAIAFLVFMIPWPYRLEVALAHPLQRVATVASTYALQTLGVAALDEGNTIVLDDVRLEVIDACSGLSMIAAFLALATAMALLIRRPAWEKVLLVLSSIPIAVVVNVLRITVTGVMHEVAVRQLADLVFHDLAGWLMMPAALVLLWLELKFLARAFVATGKPRPAAPAVPTATQSAPAVKVSRKKGRAREYLKPVPTSGNKPPPGQGRQSP
jgi:exosortase